mgnify:FL=1
MDKVYVIYSITENKKEIQGIYKSKEMAKEVADGLTEAYANNSFDEGLYEDDVTFEVEGFSLL